MANAKQNYSYNDMPGTGIFSYRLKQIDQDGKFEYSNVVDAEIKVPVTFGLAQNYPNPFNPSTTISFSLPSKNIVTITVFDLLGKEVATILNEGCEAGIHSVQFSAATISSGVFESYSLSLHEIMTNGIINILLEWRQ